MGRQDSQISMNEGDTNFVTGQPHNHGYLGMLASAYRKNSLIQEKVSQQQVALEHHLHKVNSYKLTKADVSKVLLAENIIKYKQFVYTSFTALIDNLLTCFRGAMDKRK